MFHHGQLSSLVGFCFVLFALLAQASFVDYLVREHDFDVDCPSKDASGRRGQTATEMVCAV